MNLLLRIWRSSLGKKYVMALTGLALFVFVIGHLIGNLQIFLGPEPLNRYGHFLQTTPELLWGARIGLLICVTLHIAAAASLVAMNRSARQEGYAGGGSYGSTLASRTMLVSGLVILAFVIYHLLHFTVQSPGLNGTGIDFRQLRDSERRHDVYAMMVHGFSVWWVVLFYVVGQALLFMHLGHGVASLFQSLGMRNHVWAPRIAAFAKVASIAILIGYVSIPVAVQLGLGRDYLNKVVQHALSAGSNAKETR
jgi:succinate dehydrogenase / fumarate reductase cytochrome b subunit